MNHPDDRVRSGEPADRDLDDTEESDDEERSSAPPVIPAFLDGDGSPQDFERARCAPPAAMGEKQAPGRRERAS